MYRGVERLPIEAIAVGERRREDMGDIASLADSISKWGLLHPLTVDQGNTLIAGGRRLAALRDLGYTEVEVRRWDDMTPVERRELELEENLRRKDLTAYERSKTMVAHAEVAAQIDRETGEIFRPDSGRKMGRGRPQGSESLGSLSRVSERTGIPKQTIHDAKQHVAAADKYPFLQDGNWSQNAAMAAAAKLDAMPEDVRAAVNDMCQEPAIPPASQREIVDNVAEMNAIAQSDLVRLYRSSDSRENSLAKTKAVKKPPMPDPRQGILKDAIAEVRKAIKLFPNDPEVPELESIIAALMSVAESIKERKRDVAHAAD